MYKSITVLFFLIIADVVLGQVLPKEGSALHYRIIGFSYPEGRQGSKYKIEIASGSYNNTDSFCRKIVSTYNSNKNKITGTVPAFGIAYTWRVVGMYHKTVTKSELHHFSTAAVDDVDTNVTRMRVLHKAVKYMDSYVFLDATRTLYDMSGQAVWYLPDKDEKFSKSRDFHVHDLKCSQQGTITFIVDEAAYEVNYNGDVLWRAPNDGRVGGDNSGHYHHELTRLNNGNFMVLGNETGSWEIQGGTDSNILLSYKGQVTREGNKFYQKIPFQTVIEYDQKGNVVWSWHSSKYFSGSDLANRKTENGLYDIDVHENAFYFDEQAKSVYISFKTISRIIKVKYPEGNVLHTYGKIYRPGDADMGNDFYCIQHSCRKSRGGYLYLYNNNYCHAGLLPTVVAMQEIPGKDSLRKIWEYRCAIEEETAKKGIHQFSTGGNIVELMDKDMFVCMGSDYDKLFIVNNNKKLLWAALPEQRDPVTRKWNILPSYRASIIGRKELENLIWHAEK